jgi:hypothetical protein
MDSIFTWEVEGDGLGDGGRSGDWGMRGEERGRTVGTEGDRGPESSTSAVRGDVGRVRGGSIGEAWQVSNGEGSREMDRADEAHEGAAVEDAMEVGEGWREPQEEECRMILASARSEVRRSAAITRNEVSMSLRRGDRGVSAQHVFLVRKSRGRTHSIGSGTPVVLSQHVSFTIGGGVIGRRSFCARVSVRRAPSPLRKRTLSPNPHMRALTGCCTTESENELQYSNMAVSSRGLPPR